MNTQPKKSAPVSPYCSDLRSKKLLVTGKLALEDIDVLDASQHCWCFRTQQVLGPDKAPAHPEECLSGRGCFRSKQLG